MTNPLPPRAALDAIRARCAKATAGPWEVARSNEVDGGVQLTHRKIRPVGGRPGHHYIAFDAGSSPSGTAWGTREEANMEFIAHAREDVPALLALCDALAEALRWARESVEHGYEMCVNERDRDEVTERAEAEYKKQLDEIDALLASLDGPQEEGWTTT